ncbi:hypothetical protein [Desulfoluna spongiiphila]|uniref:hypothetical protein n=1 Tax=Desulfoluna spongiiphila TaxID=419481 RepID=UPI00125A48DB|nr:hypothetical protein [Desulfoluna spongiiphila]VVS91274.1 hypothetical protein DBB_8420 [Desulfoluna spongiiphila]
MPSPTPQPVPGMFSGCEISELCDAIKDTHRLLHSVGRFYTELCHTESPGGNGLQIDFKKWGIRTITEDLLARQHESIDRITEIYREEREKMMNRG